jgi:hypothetical protein
VRSLIASSWRQRTKKVYIQCWQRWRQWCVQNKVPEHKPRPHEVMQFLAGLFYEQGLKTATVLVYKSVIVTFAHPLYKLQLEQSDDLRRMLLGMKAQRPSRIPPPVWSKDDVLQQLSRRSPDRDSIYDVSRHLLLLMLLYSGRRVHDMSLLRAAAGDMIVSDDAAVFQPIFGSKTDGRAGSDFHQSKIGFRRHDSWSLSVPHVLRRYLQLTRPWRASQSCLFLDVRGQHGPASLATMRGWVRSKLEQCGVTASAGSTRAATATAACLAGCSLQSVLDNGNWKSRKTMQRFYFRPPR